MNDTSSTKPPADNIIARLWRGDVSLPQAYWLYGCVGGVSFRLISPQVTYALVSHSQDLSSTAFDLLRYGWLAIYYCYTTFIFIAIWRSANNYALAKPEKKGNATVAKVMVVIGVLMLAGSLAKLNDNRLTSSSNGTDDQMQLEATIKGLNVGLPRKLDDVSTLNKIDIHDDTIFYYISLSTTIPNKESFKTKMKGSMHSVCSDKDLAPILKANNKLEWVYAESTSNSSVTVTMTKADCPNL